MAYVLFQWLDDDRFAVMAGAAHNEFGWNGLPGYGDILVCDIARERCTLAAKGAARRRLQDRSASGRPELTMSLRSTRLPTDDRVRHPLSVSDGNLPASQGVSPACVPDFLSRSLPDC